MVQGLSFAKYQIKGFLYLFKSFHVLLEQSSLYSVFQVISYLIIDVRNILQFHNHVTYRNALWSTIKSFREIIIQVLKKYHLYQEFTSFFNYSYQTFQGNISTHLNFQTVFYQNNQIFNPTCITQICYKFGKILTGL